MPGVVLALAVVAVVGWSVRVDGAGVAPADPTPTAGAVHSGGDPSFVLTGRGEVLAFFGTGGDTYAAHAAALGAPWLLGASTCHVPSAEPDTTTSWLHALDRGSGAEVWRFDLEDDRQGFHHQQPLVAGGTVVVATPGGNLFGVDLATGAMRWRRTAGRMPELVDLDAGRLTVLFDGIERHLDPATGRRIPGKAAPSPGPWR